MGNPMGYPLRIAMAPRCATQWVTQCLEQTQSQIPPPKGAPVNLDQREVRKVAPLSGTASVKAQPPTWRPPTMPKQQTHLPVVRQWCQSLGVLSAVSISRMEAEMKLAAYVPLLLNRFPDAAFTTDSLEYVAAQAVKGFPTYGELAAWLADWWRANRPALPALPPPPPIRQRGEPTPEEIEHVTRVVAETIAALRASAQPVADWQASSLRPKPRYLTPEQLDRINPLPNGAKRHAPATAASAAELRTAPVDPDAPARDTDADAIPF